MNRREFLSKSGTVAGAGMVLGAPSILKAADGNNDKINVALIGLGKQGLVLLESMKNIPGLHFQAVCDIWEKQALRGGAGRVRVIQGSRPNMYTDIDELLEKEKGLDAAIVATPDFWHAPHTIKCLEAGLHVYCEKMMSNTLDGARSMVHAMERTKKLCQIGHQRRSNPRYRYTLDHLINHNKICGTIVNANAQWNRALIYSQDIGYSKSVALDPETLKQYGFKNMHQFRNWRFYRDLSGGPISDLGAHQIDVFNWFLDCTPKTVFASGGNDYFKDREHFDNVMAIFEYDAPQGPVRAFYQVLTTTSYGGGFFESFMGTEATVKTAEVSSTSAIYREDSAPEWDDLIRRGYVRKKPAPPAPKATDGVAVYASAPPEEFTIPGVLNKLPHTPHLENFFAAVRGEEELNCDARHAFESEAPIFWVNPSALKKEKIVFTPEQLQV
ncbi:MAG: Gfo/Idh/MocA family oxidoreductase [Verrucomicrobiae bacterium]|nr:Gfo/Idh/MocA family oxidoreductase [Verrucomicrobiae bacterium]NNJ87609.1 Gfo/Idh/MocA family oxidoreductase [Akkermansiaceae bacterium]